MPILHSNLLPAPSPLHPPYTMPQGVLPPIRDILPGESWLPTSRISPSSLSLSPSALSLGSLTARARDRLSLQRTRIARTFATVGLCDRADLILPIVRLKVECGPQRSSDGFYQTRPAATQPPVDLCVHPYAEFSVQRLAERPFTDFARIPVSDTQEVSVQVLGRLVTFLGAIG